MFPVRIVSALLLAVFGCAAWGQAAESLTLELVDQRLRTLESASAGDDDQRVVAYREARALLVQADQQEQRTTSYLEAITSAPQQEAEIQARLDADDAAYDPASELEGFTAEEAAMRLTLARASLNPARDKLAAMDRRLSSREASITSSQARIAEIAQRLTELPSEPATINVDAPPSEAEALAWRDLAETAALVAERRAEEARQRSGPARFSLLSAERSEQALVVARLTALVEEIGARFANGDQQERQQLSISMSASDPAFPLAQRVVEDDNAIRARDAENADAAA